MTATKTETGLRIKHFFSGEHTTTWSKVTGLIPNRECGHKHRTEEAADKCGVQLLWVTYAELSDGRVMRAHDAKQADYCSDAGNHELKGD